MPKPSSYTYTITQAQGEKLRSLLESQQFEFSDLSYGHFSARKGKCSIGYYQSGKVVLQGKEAREFIEFYFEPEVTGEVLLGYEEVHNPEMFQPHFGVDEAGKGDFFGPLVIAGAYLTPDTTRKLMDAGVRDSKRVGSDKVVLEMADKVRDITGNTVSVVTIGPEKYNELYRKIGNLNRLLAWGHGQVIANLHEAYPECPRALSDQFAHESLIQRELKRRGIEIELQQRTKAESDTAVAAASIMARAAFVSAMEKLGGEKPLPKGAGTPVKEWARKVVQDDGVEALERICKMHFKTFHEVTNQLL
ncbi:MAG: ribonuclease HIII [Verrucomicrobiota bacterium]